MIEGFFEEGDINVHKQVQDDGVTIYTTDLDLECGTFNLCIFLSHRYQAVTIVFNTPINVPEPKRVDVAEYIARANYHFNEGSLILKFEDGRLVHKYSLSYEPNEDIQQIKYQLNISLGLGIDEVEKHFPRILAVIYNNIQPSEAFRKVEYGRNPEMN